MRYRRLGRTEKQVSVIGFGGASLSGEGGGYGFGEISDVQALDLVDYSLERGVNLFDTAPLYGKGLGEKRLGRALRSVREKVLIVSKCGITWHPSGRIDHHNHPDICRKMLEQSLRDLQSDYIDLYMVHYPDFKVDIRQTVEVLARAQQEGKIRFIGLCNTTLEELELAREVVAIDVVQNELNFFFTETTDQLLPWPERWDIGLMGWGTLHKGILTGRAVKGRHYQSCDVRSWAPWFCKDEKIARQMAWAQEVLFPRLGELNIDPVAFALQFSLGHAPLATALCGPRSCKQLDSLLQAMEAIVEERVFNELRELYQSWP